MPNRQYGKSRSPAGRRSPASSRNPAGSQSPAAGRGQTGRRFGRAVSMSRSPAFARGPARFGEVWTASPSYSGVPRYREPEVRRWPHPVNEGTPSPVLEPEPALHYIRCALSYQNQLLADIKVLLERLTVDQPQEAAPEAGPEKE